MPTFADAGLDLAVAALCGILLGFERERHGKAIGITSRRSGSSKENEKWRMKS